MAVEPITLDELINAISEAEGRTLDQSLRSTGEWAKHWGVHRRCALERIKKAIDVGLSVKVGHKRVIGSSGVDRIVPAFGFDHKKKASKS